MGKIDGQMKYLFAALDPKRAIFYVQYYHRRKTGKGAKQLFRKLAEVTGHTKINQTIRTITLDTLPAYQQAFHTTFISDQRINTKDPPKTCLWL